MFFSKDSFRVGEKWIASVIEPWTRKNKQNVYSDIGKKKIIIETLKKYMKYFLLLLFIF